MAGEPGVPYRADTGGSVGATPDLRAPLGAPNILRPEDFIAMANFNDPTVALKNAADLTSSLIDNHYNNQIKLAQAGANLQQTQARTNQIGAEVDIAKQNADQNAQLFPLEVRQKKQGLQSQQYTIDEQKRQADTLDKALSEYGSWNSELSALDPTDPNYDDKVAAINAKYPEASTNPRTQSLITPMLTEHNLKRNHSDLVQQRVDQLNQTRGYVENGLLPPDTDIRTEVNAGRGQALINQAKSQAVIHRLQTISALGTPGDRFWAQGEIGAISGKALGPGETPDRTMFTPTGDLNPGTDLVLSRIESRLGITPVAPGAKKEIKTTVDETTGLPKTETTITGMPVTQSDINAQKPQTPATVPGAPTTAADMQKDPIFQSIFSDIAQKKLALQGAPGSQEQTAALYAEYAKRKAAAAAAQKPGAAATPPAPGTTSTTFQPDTSGSKRLNAIYNNPGALGLSNVGRKYGATESGKFDTGHPFAQFPTKEAGAAAQFDLWQNPTHYLNHTLKDAITNWIGPGEHGEAEYISSKTGIPLDQVITSDFLRSPQGIRLMQAQAEYEGQNVLTQEQWQRGQDWAYKGIKPDAISQATSAMPVHANGHPMPRTPREAMTLGPGARFMAPDGTLRMVPNIPQYA